VGIWTQEGRQRTPEFSLHAQESALKAGRKQSAIYCDSKWDSRFGNCCIAESNNCNATTGSTALFFGVECSSVSGGRLGDFFTDAVEFTVKEINEFEIAD
jgi:hypothetical protein